MKEGLSEEQPDDYAPRNSRLSSARLSSRPQNSSRPTTARPPPREVVSHPTSLPSKSVKIPTKETLSSEIQACSPPIAAHRPQHTAHGAASILKMDPIAEKLAPLPSASKSTSAQQTPSHKPSFYRQLQKEYDKKLEASRSQVKELTREKGVLLERVADLERLLRDLEASHAKAIGELQKQLKVKVNSTLSPTTTKKSTNHTD